eukprot:458256_1
MSFIKKLLKSKKQTLNTDEMNIRIQQHMKIERQKERQTIRIMIAGALGVGKTTLLKQIRHIYDTLQSDDIERYTSYITQNVVKDMKILCRQSKKIALKQEIEKIHMHNQFVVSGFIRQYQHKLPTYITFYIIPDVVVFICIKYFANTQVLPENEQLRNVFLDMQTPYLLNIDIANKIHKLWNDPGIKQTLLCSHKFQIPDNVKYWFEKVMDLAADDYCPSLQDYITIRMRSTGFYTEVVSTDEFDSGTIWYFKFMDVGGARAERIKWWGSLYAETVDLIIYVVALNDYNKKCFEDSSMNRLHESLMLFERFCVDNKWGKRKYIVLFNKYDLFKQKIDQIPITECFDDFPKDKCGFDEKD